MINFTSPQFLPRLVFPKEKFAKDKLKTQVSLRGFMNFPKHISFTLEHNPNVIFYNTVAEYLDNMSCPPEFLNIADKDQCIIKNEIWIMTWYPDTPVGSYQVAASTLELLLELVNE
jgi:hypothetical protein